MGSTNCYQCKSCNDKIPWTIMKFLKKSSLIHGDKFDYSKITSSDIKNRDSEIFISCNECSYEFKTTVINHMYGGCKKCSNNLPWTLERFVETGNRINDEMYDYTKITSAHIKGKNSKVPVICKKCNHEFLSTIHNHCNGKCQCPKCSGCIPWNLETFIKRAIKINGTKYDYSKITISHFKNIKSKVPIICNTCKHEFESSIGNHIHGRYQCPQCSQSKGYSIKQIKWIESIMKTENIIIIYAFSPRSEHRIPTIGRVDGFCMLTNTVYEYHGDFWHGNPLKYNSNDINPVSKKSYGELYEKTLIRDQKIRNLGYDLIVKWETNTP